LENLKLLVAEIFGHEVAGQVEHFWGLNDEGELQGAFKPSGRKYILLGVIGATGANLTSIRRPGILDAWRCGGPREILWAFHCSSDQGQGDGDSSTCL